MQTRQAKRKTAIRIFEAALAYWRGVESNPILTVAAGRKIKNLAFSIERTKARLSY